MALSFSTYYQFVEVPLVINTTDFLYEYLNELNENLKTLLTIIYSNSNFPSFNML